MRKRKRNCVRVRVEGNGASVGQNFLKCIASSCCQLALLSSFWSKHIRTIYQGHCGRRTDGLDANEKIRCREEERRERQSDTSHSVVVTFSVYLMLFSGQKRKEQEERGGSITHTCALHRTWLHRFLLFQVRSLNQHQHHLGDRPPTWTSCNRSCIPRQLAWMVQLRTHQAGPIQHLVRPQDSIFSSPLASFGLQNLSTHYVMAL